MKIALELFSPTMKKALFETIFLLHYNHPKFKALKVQSVKLSANDKTPDKLFDLYQDNAPAGVLGFTTMPAQFFREMKDHVLREFQINLQNIQEPAFHPVVSISSLGSIGTIAHKHTKSDLDLQIQYDPYPYRIKTDNLSDDFFERIEDEVRDFSNKSPRKIDFQRWLPMMSHFQANHSLNLKDLDSYLKLNDELLALYDFYQELELQKAQEKDQASGYEERINRRFKAIERYLQAKYPQEELHFFAYSCKNFRQGKHGSTLESKESSGTAYEKILTYDLLLPGVYYNAVTPLHFLFNAKINNNTPFFKSLISVFRLSFLDTAMLSVEIEPGRCIDLGNTPFLSEEYLVAHRKAVYWEAFKGSSGNLPKAYLNLLRLENLNHPGYRHTIIQLIKEPNLYDALMQKAKTEADLRQLDDPYYLKYDEADPFPLEEIFTIELKNPLLNLDPWWLRYKALKIFYQLSDNFDAVEKKAISNSIDFCFALHVGLDDIVLNEESYKVDTNRYRNRVLLEFYNNAFPPLTHKREVLDNIFLGSVTEVNSFETTLKKQFREVLTRFQSNREMTNEEESIWFKYYEYNFEPKKGQILKNILSHLQKSQGRLHIFFEDNQWFFTTVRFAHLGKKRFDTFGTLTKQHEDQTDLYFDEDLLRGFIYCIVNGYYAANSFKRIKTSSTVISLLNFPTGQSGDKRINNLGKVNSYLLEKVATAFAKRFPPISVDYKESIQSAKKTFDILIVINLGHYGRVHAIYRDKMDNFFLAYQDNPSMVDESKNVFGSIDKALASQVLQKSVANLIHYSKIMERSSHNLLKDVSFWFNPLSIEHESAIREEMLQKLEQKVQEKLTELVLNPLMNKTQPASETV